MAERDAPAKVRGKARDSLSRGRFTIFEVSGLVSQAAIDERDRWFALANDFVSEGSTPSTWIRNGISFWIACFEGRLELQQRICEVLTRPPPESQPPEGITSRDLFFVLDSESESYDPAETLIPLNQYGKVDIKGSGKRLAPYMRFSLSLDGKKVLVGLVGLKGSAVLPTRNPSKKRLFLTLEWTGGSQRLTVERQAP